MLWFVHFAPRGVAINPRCSGERYAYILAVHDRRFVLGELRLHLHSRPEGVQADAGATVAELPIARGATEAMVLLGDRIFHSEVGGAACTGCHGSAATGTALGPDLTDTKWLWSDGSYAGITKTISQGVAQPKQYRSPMPARGGADLTPGQVSAVAAYIWGLSHRGP
jgi:mono/diheme cytochrome c family protein